MLNEKAEVGKFIKKIVVTAIVEAVAAAIINILTGGMALIYMIARVAWGIITMKKSVNKVDVQSFEKSKDKVCAELEKSRVKVEGNIANEFNVQLNDSIGKMKKGINQKMNDERKRLEKIVSDLKNERENEANELERQEKITAGLIKAYSDICFIIGDTERYTEESILAQAIVEKTLVQA